MDRTGDRIRARRMDAGISQRDLARLVEISPSYLNLIESGKRAAGTALVRKLARAMKVDVSLLSVQEDGDFIDRVRTAAADLPDVAIETQRTRDFVGHYPGFARLTVEQSRRIAALEARLRMLSDRIAYDPELARALHGVISSVTAIQSAAGILTGDAKPDANWQARFHRNIHDESLRLAETSRALIAYLDAPQDAGDAVMTPLDLRNEILARTGFHRAHLEPDRAGPGARDDPPPTGSTPKDPAAGPQPEHLPRSRGTADKSTAVSRLLADHDAVYARDAAALPLSTFLPAARRHDWDPVMLSAEFGAPLPCVLRRLAGLPEAEVRPEQGLMVVDSAGMVLLAKPVAGFNPAQGRGCPMWPVFTALGQPGRLVTARVTLPGQTARHFAAHAVADAVPHPGGPHLPPRLTATMLLRAVPGDGGVLATPAGLDCRICQRPDCVARREPSTVTPVPAHDL